VPRPYGWCATITDFLYRNNGNILHLDQHVDAEANVFSCASSSTSTASPLPLAEIAAQFGAIAERLKHQWELHVSDETPRYGHFVSRMGHCLYDLLARYQSVMECRLPPDRQQPPRHAAGRGEIRH